MPSLTVYLAGAPLTTISAGWRSWRLWRSRLSARAARERAGVIFTSKAHEATAVACEVLEVVGKAARGDDDPAPCSSQGRRTRPGSTRLQLCRLTSRCLNGPQAPALEKTAALLGADPKLIPRAAHLCGVHGKQEPLDLIERRKGQLEDGRDGADTPEALSGAGRLSADGRGRRGEQLPEGFLANRALVRVWNKVALPPMVTGEDAGALATGQSQTGDAARRPSRCRPPRAGGRSKLGLGRAHPAALFALVKRVRRRPRCRCLSVFFGESGQSGLMSSQLQGPSQARGGRMSTICMLCFIL